MPGFSQPLLGQTRFKLPVKREAERLVSGIPWWSGSPWEGSFDRSAVRSASALRRPPSDRLAKLERSTSLGVLAPGRIVTCPQSSQTRRINPFVVTSRVEACPHFFLRRNRPKLTPISPPPPVVERTSR
jgi:hypothetical protein